MKPNYPKSVKHNEERQRPSAADEAFEPEESEFIEGMNRGLELLERSVPVFPPNVELLERQLVEHRQTIRRRLQRDLAIFLLIAIGVLTGTIAVLSSAPVVWVGVQIAAMLAVPVVIALHRRRRVEDV
jgi:Flp pilus assembly protein TadB